MGDAGLWQALDACELLDLLWGELVPLVRLVGRAKGLGAGVGAAWWRGFLGKGGRLIWRLRERATSSICGGVSLLGADGADGTGADGADGAGWEGDGDSGTTEGEMVVGSCGGIADAEGESADGWDDVDVRRRFCSGVEGIPCVLNFSCCFASWA